MRYRYALGPSGAVLDILAGAAGDRASWRGARCLGCGSELVPVFGALRESHFRHKSQQACSRETYLHVLGKRTVVEAFRSAQQSGRPYLLTLPAKRVCTRWLDEFGLVCKRRDGSRTFDLVALFDTIEEEAPIGGFVADVLLTNSRSGENLLIEVAVTHHCEPEKLNAGHRLIEVDVWEEDDLAHLSQGLDVRNRLVSAYNLKELPQISTECSSRCARKFTAFHVYKSGKSRMQTEPPALIARERRKEATVYSHLVEEAAEGIVTPYLATGGYKLEAERAYRAGVKIRCCALCRYAGLEAWEKPMFCKFKRVEVGLNEAAECQAYRPDVARA